VFDRTDVVRLVGQFCHPVWHLAIFAKSVRALPDQWSKGGVHVTVEPL
jgi:hypothetical protein